MFSTQKQSVGIFLVCLYLLSACTTPIYVEPLDYRVPFDIEDTTQPEIIEMGVSFSEFVEGEILEIPKSQTGDLALSAIARDNESGIKNLSLITQLTVICSTADPEGDVYTEIVRLYEPTPAEFNGAILGVEPNQTVNNKGLVAYTLKNEDIAAAVCPGRSIYNFRGTITVRAENFVGLFAIRSQEIKMGPDAPDSLSAVPITVVLTGEELENSSQCENALIPFCMTFKNTDPCDSTENGEPRTEFLTTATAMVNGRSVSVHSYCEGDTIVEPVCTVDGSLRYRAKVPPRLIGCGGTVQYGCQNGLLIVKQDGVNILRRIMPDRCP